MKTLSTGNTITCQGETLLLVVNYASDVTVSVQSSTGQFVPLEVITASAGRSLPGAIGLVYQVTFASGTVDVHGSCQVA